MPERMKMESADRIAQNIEALKQIFPACVTEISDAEGVIREGVDFELLRQWLGGETSNPEESFGFTWVGKRQALADANAPIRMTLRPQIEKSIEWDTTGNIYIEGENLQALKLLQESYLEGVKLIYIDPPYNTGKDFLYNDSFKESRAEYVSDKKLTDPEGRRMAVNPETDGRFHSKWCSMMFSRLLLARSLLSKDGVIFISIDDNEAEHLKMICNEVFGKDNFEGHIHWRRRHNQPNDKTKMIGIVAEHILVYAKDSAYLKKAGVGKLDLTAAFKNPDNDPKGPWASKPWKTGSDQNGSRYTIVTPTGKVLEGEWMGEEATYQKYLEEGRIYFPKGGDGMPRKKYYQFERAEEGQCATNWWPHEQFGHNQGANDCMTELFGEKNIFSNPKPVELLKAILKVANVKDGETVLDFFSGSAAMAHAVLQLNAETNGTRRFILIQAPEACAEKSPAFQNGYRNICEIGLARIAKAAKKIRQETNADIDYGVRVFALDSSNMKDVYYRPNEYGQQMLSLLEENIKEDRSSLDLLFGCLLEWGLPLSFPCESRQIDGCTVYNYKDGELIACFDADIPWHVMEAIAGKRPRRAVFCDSGFSDSPSKLNAGELFKRLAPNTRIKVI
ncbi:MAG: site-specific DNA-methyltransferase [Lachnospiraceae bacterium]|nr:site-specific DNA-methyltransferase [Lachnospiraceae bacterium]